MSENPVFSVIIPVYNVEKYIEDCIQSLQEQTFKDFEAIFIDDCSSDNSVEIIEKYAKKDERFKILRHKTNRRQGAARNTGIDAAKGEYIVCLDSDDWYESNCLKILYDTFQRVNTNSIWFDAHHFIEETREKETKSVLGNVEGYMTITPETICSCSDYCFKAYKTSSIRDNNIRYPEGIVYEDGEFYFKYFMVNPETYVISDCLYNYRIHKSSTVSTTRRDGSNFEDIYKATKNIRDFAIERGIYNKYKKSLLKLLIMRIKTCKSISNSYEKSLSKSSALLEAFGGLDEFKEFEHIKNPKFSIIVPIYNVEKYITQCLESILNQTYPDFELICVDDCGTDNSMEIVRKYTKKDKRIKIVKHRKNKGLGAARNTALKHAKGDYVICVDSDDWLEKFALQKIVSAIEVSDLDIICFKDRVWWEDAKQFSKVSYFGKYYHDLLTGYYDVNDRTMLMFPICTWNKVYKRKFLVDNKMLWPEGVLYEDNEFFFKTFTHTSRVYLINEILYCYRRRQDSIISQCQQNSQKAEDLYRVTYQVYEYLNRNNFLKQYKNSYLRYAIQNINSFRHNLKLRPSIKEVLDKIDLSNFQ